MSMNTTTAYDNKCLFGRVVNQPKITLGVRAKQKDPQNFEGGGAKLFGEPDIARACPGWRGLKTGSVTVIVQ